MMITTVHLWTCTETCKYKSWERHHHHRTWVCGFRTPGSLPPLQSLFFWPPGGPTVPPLTLGERSTSHEISFVCIPGTFYHLHRVKSQGGKNRCTEYVLAMGNACKYVPFLDPLPRPSSQTSSPGPLRWLLTQTPFPGPPLWLYLNVFEINLLYQCSTHISWKGDQYSCSLPVLASGLVQPSCMPLLSCTNSSNPKMEADPTSSQPHSPANGGVFMYVSRQFWWYRWPQYTRQTYFGWELSVIRSWRRVGIGEQCMCSPPPLTSTLTSYIGAEKPHWIC